MPTICFINGWSGGSTGNICLDIADELSANNGYRFVFVTREKPTKQKSSKYTYLSLGTGLRYYFYRLLALIMDNDGFTANFFTKKIEKMLLSSGVDLLHINNVHSNFVNVEELVNFAEQHKIKIVWTLHDEWIVTGRCACFYECEEWKNGCIRCRHTNFYPKGLFSFSQASFWRKKGRLLADQNILFITPSCWLANLVKTRCPSARVSVINNGIDDKTFHRTAPLNVIKETSKNRFVVGSAAYPFTNRKGLDFILRLARELDPEVYFVVAAGLEIKKPKVIGNLLLLPKILSKNEMCNFYSSLDAFVNPTTSDVFSNTNMEALCCNVPVISFNVGGACEMLDGSPFQKKIPIGDISSCKSALNELRGNKLHPDFDTHLFGKSVFAEKYYDVYSQLTRNEQ